MSDNEKESMDSEKKIDPWIQTEQIDSASQKPKGNEKEGITDSKWEREALKDIVLASLNEQRKTRRWGIFFKSLMFVYLFVLLIAFSSEWGGDKIKTGKHTALVELQGVIADNTPANADSIISGLRAAFKDKNTVGVILKINSPGGSPVQAGYINDEITRLRDKYPDVPLYAVVTDICASGGYYVAAAADEIYADKASIVGSIGVLMDGFGFVEAEKKLGVQRRLLTAGENKGFLDPFSPLKQEDVMHAKGMLDNIHKQFIDVVKQGRGNRLKDSPELFSGLMWTGEQSVELGLVDGLGSPGFVAREIIGQENIVDYTLHPNFFDRFADRLGLALGNFAYKTMMSSLQGIR